MVYILAAIVVILLAIIAIGYNRMRELFKNQPDEQTTRQLKAALKLKDGYVNQMAGLVRDHFDTLASYGLIDTWVAAQRLYVASETASLEGDSKTALSKMSDANAMMQEITLRVRQVVEANSIEPDPDDEEAAMQRLRHMHLAD